MHKNIRVTGGHALDSYHRYKPDVRYMVLYEPNPADSENNHEYQCIRLFVNAAAYRALEIMESKAQIKIKYECSVRNGNIYDLEYREKMRQEAERKRQDGKCTEIEV